MALNCKLISHITDPVLSLFFNVVLGIENCIGVGLYLILTGFTRAVFESL